MSRNLTQKQRKFVNEYADKPNGVQAALISYDTTDYATAGAIAYENLKKPQIIQELKTLGFDSNNARRVVGEILNDESIEPQHRIKAAENVFKVNGDYAPDKHVNLNLDGTSTERTRELGDRIIGLLRRRD